MYYFRNCMKKTVSILLLGLLLFNWVGYQLYIAVMEIRAEKAMIADLDKHNYSDHDLVSIKVPVNYLYTYAGTSGYERVDGHVELNGVEYNYVKRRFFNDSLELLCIPNAAINKLKSTKDAFFSLVNGLQHPGQSKKEGQQAAAYKAMSGKYFPASEKWEFKKWEPAAVMLYNRYIRHLPEVYAIPAIHPPDAV